MSTITVDLATKKYDVKIDNTLHTRLGQEISAVWSARKIALLTDSNVGPLYLRIQQSNYVK